MHFHPHFLPLPPQPHHPYTPRLCQSTTVPPGEGFHRVERCGHPATLDCTSEDSLRSRLGTAKVEWVLPSNQSTQQDGRCCQGPSPVISCLSWQYSGLYLSPTLPTLLPASDIPDQCTIRGLLHNYRNPPPTNYFHIFPTIHSILQPGSLSTTPPPTI